MNNTHFLSSHLKISHIESYSDIKLCISVLFVSHSVRSINPVEIFNSYILLY